MGRGCKGVDGYAGDLLLAVIEIFDRFLWLTYVVTYSR